MRRGGYVQNLYPKFKPGIMPDPGGHWPQRPYTHANPEQAQAVLQAQAVTVVLGHASIGHT